MSAMPSPAVRLSGLSIRFGDRVAVDEVDLCVPEGMFFGLVGPNGAGKSTLLSMIAGILAPDAGSVEIAGFDIRRSREQALEVMGLMLEGFSLPERLTGSELLEYTARLRGIGSEARERAVDLLEILELDRSPSTLIVDYSTGMRKKIGLAVAMMHRPRVLVLDEPFEAIDPVSALAMETLLGQYVDGGGTVLLSSHIMDVIERSCERVAVMNDGHVLAEGTIDEVSAEGTLSETFIRLVGAPPHRDIGWLR